MQYPVIVIAAVKIPVIVQLTQVIEAGCLFDGFFRLTQSGQQHRRKNGNDRNYNEQFNQGEPQFFTAVF
jgi:hypothetical protein